jgi:hypothetical protein
MKVSRKVARRKYSRRSFVSRRRLRNKKHKKHHTQKGGKYGNRIRTRAYKRTHKRGRRFHRGGKGVEFTCPTDWKLDEEESDLSKTIKLGISKAVVSDVTLFFVKKGSFTFKPVSGNFNITLRVYNSPVCKLEILPYTPPVFEVTFKRGADSRDDNKSVTFSITNLGDFTNKEALKQLARLENPDETYDFSRDNDDTFKQIQECVRQKLKEVYEKLQKLLNFCISYTQGDAGTGIKCNTSLKNKNATLEVEDATPEDEQNVNKFLDSMFMQGSEHSEHSKNITSNLQRLRIMVGNILFLLDHTQNDALHSRDYFPNLNMALNEFGDVYRRINYNTQDESSVHFVQAQPIHA